jgi:predicted Rossmann-fold nucleotide-binding protein
MIKKIISGGQTGVDRAALDVAIKLNIPHGGWCPHGRLAEDGIIPDYYNVSETISADPIQRTEWNVRDSDGTVIFSISPKLSGGSGKTEIFARQYRKPCLHVSRERDGEKADEMLSRFLVENKIQVLNVAGPRHSEAPEVAEFVAQSLLLLVQQRFTR